MGMLDRMQQRRLWAQYHKRPNNQVPYNSLVLWVAFIVGVGVFVCVVMLSTFLFGAATSIFATIFFLLVAWGAGVVVWYGFRE